MELIPIDDLEPKYLPKDTPETALVFVWDCDNYKVLGYTGKFMHGQCGYAGFDGVEVGLNAGECELIGKGFGYFVMENGNFWEHRDWETNIVDDCGINGVWRKATREDFKTFNYPFPFEE